MRQIDGMVRRGGLGLILGVAAAWAASAGELTPDQQAMLVLNAARKAYNEGNYPFAADRFRDFLRQFGGHKQAAAAQYGLGVCLIEGPAKDYKTAVEALSQAANREDFPDRPFALEYLGMATRAAGYQELAEAQAKPNEAQDRRNRARQMFDEASKRFAAAAGAFTARVKTPPAADAALPEDLEWAARAKCDQAEMLLRLDKFKEADELATAFVADAAMARSRYRPLALYHLGYAKFAQRDYLAAGRALSQLAPFAQEFGIHARYLLGRTHHLAGERAEANTQYKAVLIGYDEGKKAAAEALKNPAALQPAQKAFYEGLVQAPPPDYILRASFYSSLLLAEDGKYPEALAGFAALIQQFPKSPIVPEAQLRLGYCQMQTKNYAEAAKALQPLAEHPALGDQALWWLGRCQAGAADPANAQTYDQALKGALQTLGRAAEKAGQFGQRDPEAKVRRGDILLDTADTQMLAKMYREAAQTYQQALTENNNPDRAEEALQRQISALHLAGLFKESDDLCKKFEEKYPKSTLLPAVVFRAAENAYLTAVAAASKQDAPAKDQLDKLFTEALTRYERVLKQYPDFQHVNLARQGMGSCYYRLGRFTDAVPVLTAIPEIERNGDMVTVSYLLADCVIRTLPPEAEDAVGAGQLIGQVEQAAKLLEGFLASTQGKAPQAPDAHLRLAYCYQRIGALLAESPERQKTLQSAQEICEKFVQQFPQDPSVPMAVFERAKVIALRGDANNAANELRKFTQDPLRKSPIAPMAAVRLSALIRSQNRAADAAKLMADTRQMYEAELQKDPSRADWVPVLQYEHALALKESGKLPEGRALFEGIVKQFAGRPEAANAEWRVGQCQRQELLGAIAAARAILDKPGAKAEDVQAARILLAEGPKTLAKTAEALQAQADDLGKKAAGSEPHLHALYELAWCYRATAEGEVEAARAKLQQEAVEKAREKMAKEPLPGQAAPTPHPPEIALSAIPLQPSEKAAQGAYTRLIAAAPENALANQARLELSELQAQRGDDAPALGLLSEALEKNPPPDITERIRLRAAALFLAKNDSKAAWPHIETVIKNAGSPFVGEARYLAGEAFIQQKDWPKAIEQLVVFRDRGEFFNIQGISDRALLRLGFALAQTNQWDQCRGTLDALVGRFGQSPWVEEARYGMGFALQMLKQFDPAVNQYGEVTRRTVSILAAKAQLQIGLCRLEQKNFPEAAKALLIVPFTYDYPELNAQAFCQAGRAYLEQKQPAEAARLWQRVVKDYPGEWAKVAEQGLAQIK